VTASAYNLRTSSSPQPFDLRFRWLCATRPGNRLEAYLALVELEWRLVQAFNAIALDETDGVAA
jgi:hypothetical protein